MNRSYLMLPRNRLPTTVVAGVRPSPLRLSATQASEPAPKPRDYRVRIDFSADGETDTFTRVVTALSAEAAEDKAYNLLIAEYGGDLDAIRFTTRRA